MTETTQQIALAERTWPEMTEPTPLQWRTWFLCNTPRQQDEIARRVLEQGRDAGRCFMLDHDGARRMIEEGHHTALETFGRQAAQHVFRRSPLIAHPTRWTNTSAVLDELAIRWNDLPEGSSAELYLPGVDAAG